MYIRYWSLESWIHQAHATGELEQASLAGGLDLVDGPGRGQADLVQLPGRDHLVDGPGLGQAELGPLAGQGCLVEGVQPGGGVEKGRHPDDGLHLVPLAGRVLV